MRRNGKALLVPAVLFCLAALAACRGGGNANQAATNGQDEPKPEEGTAEAEASPPLDIPPPPPGDVTTIDGTRLASFTGDAEAGGQLARRRCTPCHDTEGVDKPVGPTLHGIIGRPAASDSYNYSVALRTSRIIWTPEKINQFIELPRRIVPGGKMTFAGIRRGQDRADVIAWLATQ